MEFNVFALHPDVAAGVAAAGYITPTPIQAQAIMPVLQGRDVMALAQTGTGKTADAAVAQVTVIAGQLSAHITTRIGCCSLMVTGVVSLGHQTAGMYSSAAKAPKVMAGGAVKVGSKTRPAGTSSRTFTFFNTASAGVKYQDKSRRL